MKTQNNARLNTLKQHGHKIIKAVRKTWAAEGLSTKKRWEKRAWFGAPLVLLLLLLFLATGGQVKKEKENPLSHVDAQKMQAQDIEYVLNYPSFVQGVVDYLVVPRISGVIYKKFYTEGTFVKKGQPLYQIDPRPFEWELKGYEGQLIKDQAARDNYKIIYERYKKLYRDKAVSKQDVELARINYLAAVGNVKTDEANIGQMKLNLRYSLVRSPADGFIAERVVTVGTMVTAFETVLNKINSVNQMYLLFSMPENQRLEIEDGMINQTIKIPEESKFPIDLRLANGKLLPNSGYVEFIDTRIALTNGAWNMRAYVNNEHLQNKLLSGQYATVFIKGIQFLQVFGLPQAAIMQDDTGQYVYVIEEDKAVKRYITPGKMYAQDKWMVTKGLKNDDIVITKGNIRINAGQHVVIDKLEVA